MKSLGGNSIAVLVKQTVVRDSGVVPQRFGFSVGWDERQSFKRMEVECG